MKKWLLFSGLIFIAGCTTNTHTNDVSAQMTTRHGRQPASDQPLSIAGRWTGWGTYKTSRSITPFPLTCGKLVGEVHDSGQRCTGEFDNSPNGELFSVDIACVDTNISDSGHALFKRSLQVCQTTNQSERHGGLASYFTSLSTIPKPPAGYDFTLSLAQIGTSNMVHNPFEGAKEVIEFGYAGSKQYPDHNDEFEGNFFRPVGNAN